MKIGVSSVDITPDFGVPLAGYAARSGLSEGADIPVRLKALFIQGARGSRALLISADLLWWDPVDLTALQREIARRWKLPIASQFFCASHTHSAPTAGRHFELTLGKCSTRFRALLKRRLFLAIDAAREDLEEVNSVRTGRALCRIGIHRRKRSGGRIIMAPNPSGPVDPEVTLIELLRGDGSSKAVLVNFGCHPTTKGDLRISSEFCGAAMDMLEEKTKAGCLFLQGFCGDVRPKLVKEGRFAAGTSADISRLGKKLYLALLKARRNATRQTLGAAVRGKSLVISLKMDDRSADAVRCARSSSLIERRWAVAMRKRAVQTALPLRFSILEIGGLLFFGANGELVVDYGLYLKKLAPRLIPVGYVNGMTGYIPTDEQIREGGYEGGDAHKAFLLPGPFRAGIEKKIKKALKKEVKRRILQS